VVKTAAEIMGGGIQRQYQALTRTTENNCVSTPSKQRQIAKPDRISLKSAYLLSRPPKPRLSPAMWMATMSTLTARGTAAKLTS
jgi:hypothetical protein